MDVRKLVELTPWIFSHFGAPRTVFKGYTGETVKPRPEILVSREKFRRGYASPKHRSKV